MSERGTASGARHTRTCTMPAAIMGYMWRIWVIQGGGSTHNTHLHHARGEFLEIQKVVDDFARH